MSVATPPRPGVELIAASVGDPAGVVCRAEGRLRRQVTPAGAAGYDALIASWPARDALPGALRALLLLRRRGEP